MTVGNRDFVKKGFQIRCHTVRRALRLRLMIAETGAEVKALLT